MFYFGTDMHINFFTLKWRKYLAGYSSVVAFFSADTYGAVIQLDGGGFAVPSTSFFGGTTFGGPGNT